MHAAEEKVVISPEAIRRTIRTVEGKLARLENVTAELFDVTRICQARFELERSKLDLGALVREVLDEFSFELEAARCPINLECDERVVGCWDAARIRQVVTNLLTNAMKFGAKRPIEIRIRRPDGLVRLSVTDHGIGVEQSRVPRVFERFERAVSLTKYGGLGLGLYVARAIVLAHGGAIELDSTVGGGATFTVSLPVEPCTMDNSPQEQKCEDAKHQ
ncbi:MAG TPA: HAMP domain-containing sensor histidine kinase [Labilithrix sp.]|nr:HAMP domain-containing sensor histidine kinase [Labilithrix sp.]